MELMPLKTGIDRQRIKGGVSPGSLYDLVNGYVDIAGNPVSRPGTTSKVTLPSGTIGLCAFEGKLHVFSIVTIDPGSDLVVVDVLVHPDPNFTGALTKIHFAKPFLGHLYVVAEFSDGNVYHFWIQSNDAWIANHVYLTTDRVQPVVRNGLVYQPTTSNNPPAWSPNTAYEVGDVVQPTTYNGYAYELTEVDGDSASSGDTEPDWIASEGAIIDEDVDNTPATSTTTTDQQTGIPDRYKNLSGYPGGLQ